MRTLRVRAWLRLSVGLQLTAACLLLAWAVFWPVGSVQQSKRATVTAASPAASGQSSSSIDLADFALFWPKRLQQPLAELAPKLPNLDLTPTVTQPTAAPLLVKLLGTVLEQGHSLAMFSTAQGTVEFKGIGQTVGNGLNSAEVVEIQRKQAVVRFRGQLITVAVEGLEKS